MAWISLAAIIVNTGNPDLHGELPAKTNPLDNGIALDDIITDLSKVSAPALTLHRFGGQALGDCVS